MNKSPELLCKKISWQGREAYLLQNNLVRLVHLTGGGHVAEFSFQKGSGLPQLNPLWNPPWRTIEPYHYRSKAHGRTYGPAGTGKLLSGIVGHNICLDYFGPPSDEEERYGLSIHGEAPVVKWQMARLRVGKRSVSLLFSARLPVAGLRFSREVSLFSGESVAYFLETVENEEKADHFFHWQQHVTLGPPFIARDDCRVAISATKGRTYPHGYEGSALLESSRDFSWPNAPRRAGGAVDLREPLTTPGLGFVVSLLLDSRREVEYVAALNRKHRLLIGYCFLRRDYPWVAIWEENRARKASPWLGKTETRGLEFGSAPFPVARREAFTVGTLFGAPTFTCVPARGRKVTRYLAFLALMPEGYTQVGDVIAEEAAILVRGRAKKDSVRLEARGLRHIGLQV